MPGASIWSLSTMIPRHRGKCEKRASSFPTTVNQGLPPGITFTMHWRPELTDDMKNCIQFQYIQISGIAWKDNGYVEHFYTHAVQFTLSE